ncbi:amino acid adenylation domain-containing protein [Streptacidiphilus sp. 4-A2]|nr:amino acid adenylation domain-containing protein [Streptacidiphilus sp. 4-A2]
MPVPARVWDKVRTACARWRVTPYMLVLAAYALLLSRLGGQRELVVGSPSSGRASLADTETVGTFVTTTPLRLRIDPGATVRDLLDQVRGRVLDAMRYGGVGLEEIVDGLGLPRSTAYAPLVQAFCGLDQLDMSTPQFGPGVESERMATPCTRAKFELGLGFEVTASGVVADWEYRTELFDAATVTALAGAHLALLEALTADGGDRRLAALDAVGAARSAPRPGGLPPAATAAGPPVPERIAARAALTPQAVALRTTTGAQAGTETGTETNYHELDCMARRLAAGIRAAGVGREDTVLLALERGSGWAVGLLGTWYAGAAAVPLDLSLPDRRLRAMAAGAGARLAVAADAEAAKAAAARIGGEHSWTELPGAHGPLPCPDLPGPVTLPGSLAYVMFTSGSTGRPKAVAVGHDALAHHADAFAERFALSAADVVTQFAGLAFDVAFEEAVPVLCAGGTVLLLEDNTVAPRELEQAVATGGGTLVNLPSSYWAEWARDLERRPRALPARLRTVVIGSEAGRTADLERWAAVTDVPVVNAYGQTETAITSLTHACASGDADPGAVLPVGVPLPGVRAYLLDSVLSPVPPGLPGELYLAGPGLGRGYPGRPATTAGRFVADPFGGVPGARMYRTGDRARIGADGALRFLGRFDDQVKIRGHRVQLAEVESAIAAHPHVAEVAARAVLGETTTQLAAYVVARPGSTLDLGALRRFLTDRVPGYQVPAHLVELQRLPRTTGGKVLPGALPDPVRQPAAPAGGQDEQGDQGDQGDQGERDERDDQHGPARPTARTPRCCGCGGRSSAGRGCRRTTTSSPSAATRSPSSGWCHWPPRPG